MVFSAYPEMTMTPTVVNTNSSFTGESEPWIQSLAWLAPHLHEALCVCLQVSKMVRQKQQMARDAIQSIHGKAAMMEDLMAWISEALALLASKENNSIPDDLTTADALLKEHLVTKHC